jgi:hypothetical protein
MSRILYEEFCAGLDASIIKIRQKTYTLWQKCDFFPQMPFLVILAQKSDLMAKIVKVIQKSAIFVIFT